MNLAEPRSLKRDLLSLGWTESALVEPDAWPRGSAAERLLPDAVRRFEPLYLVQDGVRSLIILWCPQPVLERSAETLGVYRDASPQIVQLLDLAAAFAAPGECVLLADV